MTYIARLRGHFEEKFASKLSTAYVDAKGLADVSIKASEVSQTLLQAWRSDSPSYKSTLILGEAGLGKTECARQMAQHLWNIYDTSAEKLLPIYFNIAAYKHRAEGVLQMVLQSQGLAKNKRVNEVSTLQQDCQEGRVHLVLLIDGFDEGVPVYDNIYLSNQWHAEWGDLKVVAFSRPSFLLDIPEPSQYQALFTMDLDHPESAFNKIRLQPFDSSDIDRYLGKYIALAPAESLIEDLTTVVDFKRVINSIPALATMVTNPFILTQVVRYLPQLMLNIAEDPGYLVTRERVYEAVMQEDFSKKAVERIWVIAESQAILRDSGINSVEKLQTCMQTYTERVAKLMWHRGEGRLQLFLSNADSIRPELFIDLTAIDIKPAAKNILREHSVLQFEEGVWQPRVHKSIVEFFVSKALFRSMHLLIDQQMPNPDISLNSHSLRSEPNLIFILVDMVHTEVGFSQRLIKMVQASNATKEVRIAAANALTVLVAAKHPVSDLDFSGVSVVGADLKGMIADHTKFIGADLTGCDMDSAWVAHADFTNAILDDVAVANGPEIVHKKQRLISAIAIDAEKGLLFAGDVRGKVMVWDVATAKKISMQWLKADDKYQQYRRDQGYPSIFIMHLNQNKTILTYATQSRVWLRHIDSGGLKYLDFSPANRHRQLLNLRGQPTVVALSPTHLYDFKLLSVSSPLMLISESTSGTYLYDVDQNRPVKYISRWRHFDVSPDGKTLVCCQKHDYPSLSGGIVQVMPMSEVINDCKVNSARTLAIKAFETFGPKIFASQFSPSGRYLLFHSSTLMLFDTATWTLIRTLGKNNCMICPFIHFFPDESCALVSTDNEHTVWHLETGTRYYVFKSQHITWELYGQTISPNPCISMDNAVWFSGSTTLRAKAITSQYRFQQKVEPVLDQAQLDPFPSFWNHGGALAKLAKYKKFYNGKRMTCHFLPSNFPDKDAIMHFRDGHFPAGHGESFTVQLGIENPDGTVIFQKNASWECTSLYAHKAFSDIRHYQQAPQAVSALSPSQGVAVLGFALLDSVFEIYSFLRLDAKIEYIRKLKHDNYLRIYNVHRNKLIRIIKPGHVYKAMFFSADNKLLITYGDGVRIWDWQKGKRIDKYEELGAYITAAVLTKDMQWFIMSTADLAVHAYNRTTGQSCSLTGLVSQTASVQLHHDDRSFVVWTEGTEEFFVYQLVDSKDYGAYIRLMTGTYEIGFNGEGANLDSAFLNSVHTVGLFREHGSIGEPSYYDAAGLEEQQRFLEYFSHSCEIVDVVKGSLLAENIPIMYDSWVVTLARHKKEHPKHAFILLEGMDGLGHSVAVRFDFATFTRAGKVKSGYGKVCIRPKTLAIQDNYEECVHEMLRVDSDRIHEMIRGRSWMITREEGLFLFKSMVSQKTSGLVRYGLLGAPNYKSDREHNCYTYARDQLRKIKREAIDRDLPEKAGDFFVVVPSSHLRHAPGL